MNFKALLDEQTIQFRVRYQETDQMKVVYHANYLIYFEMGRTEQLRSSLGISYRDVEDSDVLLVVAKAECSYRKPARYDDLLTLKTRVIRTTRFRIEHEYRLFRDQELLAVGHTVLVSVDRDGKIIPGPVWMQNLSELNLLTEENNIADNRNKDD